LFFLPKLTIWPSYQLVRRPDTLAGAATVVSAIAGARTLVPVAAPGSWPSNFLAPAPLGAIAVLGFAGSGIAYLLYYSLLAEVWVD
jgi:hypothetical protein